MKSVSIGALVVATALAVSLTGCATLISGTSQTVIVNSNPPGAHVKIGYQMATTPATIEIPKGKNYPVEVTHGRDKRLVPLARNIDPVFWLNIIPPLWPGFIVDAVTGATTKYEPDFINVDFTARPAHDDADLVRMNWQNP